MKLIYSTSITYPSPRANRIQILAMSKEFNKILGKDFYLGANIVKKVSGEYGAIVNFRQTKSFILAFKTLSFIKQEGVEIVYCREDKLLFFIIVYNTLFFHLKLKYFFEAHDIPPKKFLFRVVLNWCHGVVALTTGLKKDIEALSVTRKIIVASDGVDLSLFNEERGLSVQKAFDLPLQKKIVLYTGHLYSWKGVDTLASAAKFFDDTVLFVFIGGTAIDTEMFKKKYSGIKNIVITGQREHSEIPSYLKSADVLVLPNSGKEAISRLYTSPIKMFEYMASGKPIVASDLPSLREVLNSNNSVLFPSHDETALADAIKKVLHDPLLASNISKKAFMDVQEYIWEKRAKSILAFIGEPFI